MLKKIAFLFLLFASCLPLVGKVYAQENAAESGTDEKVPDYYEKAFTEIKAMLEGRRALSFKHAVIITENAQFVEVYLTTCKSVC